MNTDLSEWTRFGGGFQGDSFNHKTNPGIVLKLFSENVDKEYVQREYDLGVAIRNAGIKCPAALEILQIGNRWGIVFQRVIGKKSFCRLGGQQPEMIGQLASRLASMIRRLHSKSSEGLPFPHAVQIYQNTLDENTILDEQARATFQKAIDQIAAEDKATLIHGDFHFGNVITDGKEDYFIDLGNLSSGDPAFDIAMFYIVTHFAPVALLEKEFHISVSGAMEFWNAFKRDYYGKDIPDEQILVQIKNYLLARVLWILKDSGNAPFAVAMMKIFLQEDCPCQSRDYI